MPCTPKLNITLPVFATALALGANAALAADPVGLWRTQPDQKGQVANVRAETCGSAICGTIVRVYDKAGAPVAAPTVGQKVFWDMVPKGSDFVGRAFVPAHQREYAGRISVQGDRMKVSGCLGPVCQSQVWTRLQ
ncbi:DUF2147 domain-containing protein [Tateyamaria armeniaca]|uniref:DUF2147 domain-containing protein n=1 Tax=Tateyamaria armeniaca TaxID=2518930 RepID=A0ABW8UYG0_9RHOB